MSGSLNAVTLLGNLGRDPEVRSVQSGDKVANLSLATSERWKDKNSGEQREKTEWHRVTIWGPAADIAERYLKKGERCLVQGQLETRKWQDQAGEDRYTTEVVVRGFGGRLVLLGDGQSRGGGQEQQQGGQQDAPVGDDDEIPF
ncbi:MAG: single-stranded DNA-binding protein [Geminicoccaceae bacterium]